MRIIKLALASVAGLLLSTAYGQQPISWNFPQGITVDGETITRTSTGSAPVVIESANITDKGQNCYLEFCMPRPGVYTYIGFDEYSDATGNPAISYNMYFTGQYMSVRNGTTVLSGNHGFVGGTTAKINLTGGKVEFYLNGVLKYTTTYNNTRRYKIKAVMESTGDAVSGIKTNLGIPYKVMTSTSTTKFNYIKETTPLKPVKSNPSTKVSTNYMDNVSYYDGLGHMIEEIQVIADPYGRDIIKTAGYSNSARTSKESTPFNRYNPYNRSTVVSEAGAKAYTTSDPIYNYTTQYEKAPDARVLSVTNPDNSKKTYAYGTNTDKLIKMYVDNSGDLLFKAGAAYEYAPGSLESKTVKDEDGKSVTEYYDKLGNVVVREEGSARTYYVYDSFSRLRYVVQPKGSESIQSVYKACGEGATLSVQYALPDVINENCFYYEYDSKARLIKKKIPGKDMEYIVYNNRNLPVATQDGNLRANNQWRYYKYDENDRLIVTGIYNSSENWSNLENSVRQYNGSHGNVYFETKASESYYYTTTNTFPGSNTQVEKEIYYDNYHDRMSNQNFAYDASRGFTSTYSKKVKNLVTGEYVRILGTNNFKQTRYYYDSKGRMIQSVTYYAEGSDIIKDIVSYEYSFTDKVTRKRHYNSSKIGGVTKTYTINNRYVYDHRDRLTDEYEQVNSEPEVLLAHNVMDGKGRLKEVDVHRKGMTKALHKTVYSYDNKMGRLTGINANDPNSYFKQLFSMSLDYNSNGNVKSQSWSDKSGASKTTYYSYDSRNRLTGAGASSGGTELFKATYDANGNLTSMKQGTADNLTYSYLNGGNRLGSVSDSYGTTGDFTEVAVTGAEYTYDNNGNMTADKNRKMTISYNNRNLPATVTVNGNKIEYVYDADGTLMRRKVTNGGAVTTHHYMGDIVYSQTSSGLALSYITTSRGRIMPASGEHSYEYNITDHLGNLRASFNNLTCLQENSYNPYGTQSESKVYSGQPKNNYLFNGKEQQTEIAGFGFYNYGARFYDPALGRWHSIDPLAEKYYSISPYAYCGNNPIIRVDKDGRDWDVVINHDQRTVTIKANFTTFSGTQATQTLENSAADWNAQSGKFNYVVGEGNDAISYTVNFDITVNHGGNGVAENNMSVLPDNSKIFQERTETDASGNEIKIQPQGASNGKDFAVKQSQSSNKNVTSHEMGHNLGMNHTSSGLMKSTRGGTTLKGKNVTETLGHSQVGQGRKNSSINARLKSRQEVGNAPEDFQKGKIQENKNWQDHNF